MPFGGRSIGQGIGFAARQFIAQYNGIELIGQSKGAENPILVFGRWRRPAVNRRRAVALGRP